MCFTRVGSGFTLKYKTRLESPVRDKNSALLRHSQITDAQSFKKLGLASPHAQKGSPQTYRARLQSLD
jgi:hypothetical protein